MGELDDLAYVKDLIGISALMNESLTTEYHEKTSDDEIESRLDLLSKGLHLQRYDLSKQITFRARIGDFDDLSALSYPPSHLVSDYGRLNRINESVYYCATKIDGAVLEIRPRVNDVVTVVAQEFESIDALGVGMDLASLIGSHFYDCQHAILGKLAMYRSNLTAKDLIRSDMANAFVHRLITAPTTPIGHRVTAVIAGILSKQHQFDGFLFPATVTTQLNIGFGTGNLALKPEFVDRKGTPIHLYKFRIEERTKGETRMKCVETRSLEG